MKISRPLFQATAVIILTYASYILIFILPLREKRAGEAWEPSNK
jgi:hypothetical protein